MDTILRELVEAHPDIFGGFIAHEKKGILASQLSLISGEAECRVLLQKLLNMNALLGNVIGETAALDLYFGSAVLTGYPCKAGHWLVVTHASTLSAELLAANASLAIAAINTRAEPSASPASHQGTVDTAFIDAVNHALAKVIGPISTLVVDDLLAAWPGPFQASAENRERFLQLLQREFDTKEQCDRFASLLAAQNVL